MASLKKNIYEAVKAHYTAERDKAITNIRLQIENPVGVGEHPKIVEDIITTGGSVFELIDLANTYDAEIAHVVNLVDRSPEGISFGIPSTALLHLPSNSYDPNKCPQCMHGFSLTERGRTGKKI